MPAPALLTQTTYAELLERCEIAAFNESFHDDGSFTPKTVRGRRYWYFQTSTSDGRTQRYVGPETPELLARITHHREARDDENERRTLMTTLVRSFGLPAPLPEMGNLITGLAKAGVFRLRGVLVGTLAYQSYAAMLGVKLKGAAIRTDDIDIAQFKTISVAMEDQTHPMLEVLKTIDESFQAVPNPRDDRRITSYAARGGLRVEFLTPNEGPDTEMPEALPALQTDAQPLRFLDYLIHDPLKAVILHDAGIYVHVPAPERYAIHKLIVSRRRREPLKRDKDLQQADVLLGVLADKQPHDLKRAWDEAYKRGPKWRRYLGEGMSRLSASRRDSVLKVVGNSRSIVPGLDLTFRNPAARYDFDREIITFVGESLSEPVTCAVSYEALDDHFGPSHNPTDKERREKFRNNRSAIEALARTKFLSWPIEESYSVLIRTEEVPTLLETSRVVAGGVKRTKPARPPTGGRQG